MQKPPVPFLLAFSDNFYNQLLRLYPARFRQVYGLPMAQTFRDCCREVYFRKGVVGLARLWSAALSDLFKNVAAEYFLELLKQGERKMGEIAVSLIVPVYNEGANLEKLVNAALDQLPQLEQGYEVVIINDGSRDETAQVADRLAAAHPEQVRVIHHATNKGYRNSLRAGLVTARGARVMYANRKEPSAPTFLKFFHRWR